MNDIFAPMPPMESLEARILRHIERELARNPDLYGPVPVGPRLPFNQADMYDPRENVPGRTYWGD